MTEKKKTCSVVMIPERRTTCVGLIQCIKNWESSITPDEDYSVIGDLSYGKNVSKGVFEFWEPQKLLFVSSEKIRTGDLYLDDANQIRQSFVDSELYWSSRKTYRKIEAQSGESPNEIPAEWIRDYFVPSQGKIHTVNILTGNPYKGEVLMIDWSDDKILREIPLGPTQECSLKLTLSEEEIDSIMSEPSLGLFEEAAMEERKAEAEAEIEEAALIYLTSVNSPALNTSWQQFDIDIFKAGVNWERNYSFNEVEVRNMLTDLIYQFTQKTFTMEGCSVAWLRAKMYLDNYKKSNQWKTSQK